MQRYVLGFAFGSNGVVVLIKKNRPPFLKGQWNGVGGKIEDGETKLEAMVREFREETGMNTDQLDWIHYGDLSDDVSHNVTCFFSIFPPDDLIVSTTTDEEVFIWEISDVNMNYSNENLFRGSEIPRLIHLALSNCIEKDGVIHIK